MQADRTGQTGMSFPGGGYEAGALRTRVQHNPKSSSYQTRHVDPTVMRRKQPGLPREIPRLSEEDAGNRGATGLPKPRRDVGGSTSHRDPARCRDTNACGTSLWIGRKAGYMPKGSQQRA
jgi:hypothetical protein